MTAGMGRFCVYLRGKTGILGRNMRVGRRERGRQKDSWVSGLGYHLAADLLNSENLGINLEEKKQELCLQYFYFDQMHSVRNICIFTTWKHT